MTAVGLKAQLIATGWTAPVPARATVLGLPGALSVIVTVPDRDPDAVGAKVTLIVQEAPAATDVPQVFVCAKSPEATMPEMASGPVPVLESVTDWAAEVVPTAWEANVSEAAERLTPGTVPVPERATVRGLPVALSVIVTAPVRPPAAVGVNVTLMVQEAPAASEVPQAFVCAKSPVATMPEIASGAVPVLESVTVWAAEVVPTSCPVKVSDVGESAAVGAVTASVAAADAALEPAFVVVTAPAGKVLR
jgi:hypothetical protein